MFACVGVRGGEGRGGGAPALEIDQIILCVCVMYGGEVWVGGGGSEWQ